MTKKKEMLPRLAHKKVISRRQQILCQVHNKRLKGVCPLILHGDPLTDRKSTFQAHVAEVLTTNEVSDVIHIKKFQYKRGHTGS